MKVYSLHPNTKKYFEDKSDYINITDNMYQGLFNQTPVYPLYTFSTNNRFNYNTPNIEIKFQTMLPIKRFDLLFFRHYFIEIEFNYIIDIFNKDSLNHAIIEFNKFCELSKSEINIKNLIK